MNTPAPIFRKDGQTFTSLNLRNLLKKLSLTELKKMASVLHSHDFFKDGKAKPTASSFRSRRRGRQYMSLPTTTYIPPAIGPKTHGARSASLHSRANRRKAA